MTIPFSKFVIFYFLIVFMIWIAPMKCNNDDTITKDEMKCIINDLDDCRIDKRFDDVEHARREDNILVLQKFSDINLKIFNLEYELEKKK